MIIYLDLINKLLQKDQKMHLFIFKKYNVTNLIRMDKPNNFYSAISNCRIA